LELWNGQVVQSEVGDFKSRSGIDCSGLDHQNGLGFARVWFDSPGDCPDGDVLQIIVEDSVGHHRIVLACPNVSVVVRSITFFFQ
jgi:hypothetical protein